MFNDDKKIEEVLAAKTPEEVNQWLRLRDRNQKEIIFEEWVESITWTQLSALERDFQSKMCELLSGSPNKNIYPSDRVFYVNLTSKGKASKAAPSIGKGSKNNIRNFTKIEGPTRLNAQNAVYTALKYGPDSKNPRTRGLLTELSEDAYFKATKKGK